MKKHSKMLHLIALLIALSCSGCYTFAGTKLQSIDPQKPTYLPPMEYTVGDFAFTLEGGKMITSNKAGQLLSDGIMKSWKKRGYIGEWKYVEGGMFSRTADYNITLSGTQYGESSVVMQVLSGLTLYLLPYSVTQNYDLHYTVEEVKTGKKYQAAVQESDEAIVELFLLFALPFAQNGHEETLQKMGDHLYDQLARQGAFQHTAGPR
jgi:hypothetical protein